MEHDELVEAAQEAINKVFGDRSVPISVTRDSLEELRGDIDIILETL